MDTDICILFKLDTKMDVSEFVSIKFLYANSNSYMEIWIWMDILYDP
jgi:hypothetical protein